MKMEKITLGLIFLALTACDNSPVEKVNGSAVTSPKLAALNTVSTENTISHRWYTKSDIALGAKTYQLHCVQCHNINAAGTPNWKTTLADGNYPPPPLNGSAHAWHHDMGTLTRTIENGGIALGGVMPGFSDKLSDAEIRAVIAYFQSFWSDDVYHSWLEIGGLE